MSMNQLRDELREAEAWMHNAAISLEEEPVTSLHALGLKKSQTQIRLAGLQRQVLALMTELRAEPMPENAA